MKKTLLILFVFICQITFCQQLISITPVSENTILLRFDEGQKDFSNFDDFFIYSAPNAAYYGSIDENQALIPNNFSITSDSDPFYALPQIVSSSYFKAKEQIGLMEYYIYLTLPQAMQNDNSYTVNISNINTEESSYTLDYNVFETFSESIHVNQVGIIPSATQKYAYVSQWLGKNAISNSHFEDFTPLEGTTCHVVKASDNSIIYSGSGDNGLQLRLGMVESDYPGVFATQFWYNSPVWEFDFSEVGLSVPTDENEEYKIVIEGIGSSFPFKISNKAFEEVYKTIANSMLYQRSGFDRSSSIYEPFIKPIDLMPGVDGFEITYSNYRRMDNLIGDADSFEQLPAQATSFVNPSNFQPWMSSPDNLPWGSGGHFDAGDFDIYIEHLRMPLYASLIYQLAPNGFSDGDLDIPENSNGVPDILDEVQWTLDFFRRTKGPTGGICGGKESDGYHAPSWNDGSGESASEKMWWVYKEDPFASYGFAAASASFAKALQVAGDPNDQAQIYIDAAIDAYFWANNNATMADLESVQFTFQYIGKMKDARLLAAANLYDVTGSQEYLDYYIDTTFVNQPNDLLYQFEQWDHALATWFFSLIPNDKWPNFDIQAESLKENQIQAIVNWSQYWGLDDVSLKPIRFIKSRFDPPIGGSTGSTQRILPQIMAYHHTNDPSIINSILSGNDMYLGGNPENKVFITRADLFGAERVASETLHDESMRNGGVAIPGIPLYTHSLDKQELFMLSPPVSDWPYMELNLDSRTYFLQAEFTVHQTTVPAMMFFGYLNSLFNPDVVLSTDQYINENQQFIIYPNPNQGVFTISFKDNIRAKNLSLLTLNGEVIDISYTNMDDDIEVSTTKLTDGMYILNFDIEGKSYYHKVLVKN